MKNTSMTRRDLLKTTTMLAGGTALAHLFPGSLAGAFAQQGAPRVDALTAVRAQMAAIPIEAVELTNNLTMLAGPGGNVLVLTGPDGKVLVDGFVQPAWEALSKVLAGMGTAPVTTLINTHWHFDHTDNNANFRLGGAMIFAHENTWRRLQETHELLGMRFDPVPMIALPTSMFRVMQDLQANGEAIEMGHFTPAHTNTDIFVRYPKANVLHLGDTFFNGMYPVIDAGTTGSIHGMIEAADRSLTLSDARTRIIPGHGPVADRAALTKFRDMMADTRGRIAKLKASGRTLEEVVAEKPTASYDAAWGKGFLTPDQYVGFVYDTL